MSFQCVLGSPEMQEIFLTEAQQLASLPSSPQMWPLVNPQEEEDTTSIGVDACQYTVFTHNAHPSCVPTSTNGASLESLNEAILRVLMGNVTQAEAQGVTAQARALCLDLIATLKRPLSLNAVFEGCAFLAQRDFREGDYNPLWCYAFAAQACVAQGHTLPPTLLLALAREGFHGEICGKKLTPVLCYAQAFVDLHKADVLDSTYAEHSDALKIDALLGLGRHGYTGRLGGALYLGIADVFKDAYTLSYLQQDQRRLYEALMGLGNTGYYGLLSGITLKRPIDAHIAAYEYSLRLFPADQIRALLAIARAQKGFENIARQTMGLYDVHNKAVELARDNGLEVMHAQCLLNIGVLGAGFDKGVQNFGGRPYKTRHECLLHAYDIARNSGAKDVQERAILGLCESQICNRLSSLNPETLDLYNAFVREHMDDRWVLQYLFECENKQNYLTRGDLERFLEDVMGDRYVYFERGTFEDDQAYEQACADGKKIYQERTKSFMEDVARRGTTQGNG
ncbi:MAG: hypothetical protein C0514_06395 [Candidatus Puniceispirillum sp.]|nr:hypothetical protein [Candidatus Puniceispirillum sp.]